MKDYKVDAALAQIGAAAIGVEWLREAIDQRDARIAELEAAIAERDASIKTLEDALCYDTPPEKYFANKKNLHK